MFGSHPVIIIDARFDYEFQAGHIQGAINIDNQQTCEKELLHDLDKLRHLMQTNTIIVFHCEFSERRGPTLWRGMRDLDRRINMAKCENGAKIFFPEMYVLEKGYKGFFEKYPGLCLGKYKA